MPERKLLDSLPYDQYSRYYWVKTLIDYCRKQISAEGRKLTILDVGGNHGYTTEFFSKDSVKIIDLENDAIDPKNFIKGDATQMPFRDNEFDFLVTFDVYEHIPRASRKKFLKEMSRVSKFGFFLTAPFDDKNGHVSYAEVLANNFYNEVVKKDHRWLKEHIDNKTPAVKEIQDTFSDMGVLNSYLSSNPLQLWIPLLELHFLAEHDYNPELIEATKDVNRFYNSNIDSIDLGLSSDSYRRVFFATTNDQLHKKVSAKMEELTNASMTEASHMKKLELVDRINKPILLSVQSKTLSQKKLQEQHANLLEEYHQQQGVINKLNADLADIVNSRGWKAISKMRSAKRKLLRKSGK